MEIQKTREWLDDYETLLGGLEPVNDIIDRAAQIIREIDIAILEAKSLDMGNYYEIATADWERIEKVAGFDR